VRHAPDARSMQLERQISQGGKSGPTGWRSLLVFLLIFAGAVLSVPDAFAIKPASDDFPIINEIHRGDRQGPGVFFTDAVTPFNYRPLKSLTIWAFGSLPGFTPYFWIRCAHLLGLLGMGLVTLLWVRTLRLGWIGIVVAGLVIFLHPTLPQAWG